LIVVFDADSAESHDHKLFQKRDGKVFGRGRPAPEAITKNPWQGIHRKPRLLVRGKAIQPRKERIGCSIRINGEQCLQMEAGHTRIRCCSEPVTTQGCKPGAFRAFDTARDDAQERGEVIYLHR
jgi:hypothetical protein